MHTVQELDVLFVGKVQRLVQLKYVRDNDSTKKSCNEEQRDLAEY